MERTWEDPWPANGPVARLRARIARQLLAHRGRDGRIAAHPYRKWQGPHWALFSLALAGYPPGDASLLPMRDQVCD